MVSSVNLMRIFSSKTNLISENYDDTVDNHLFVQTVYWYIKYLGNM